MKKLILIAVLGLVASVAYAGQRVANAYKATKLNITSVLVSCNDEREPTVSKLENTTMIVISCKQQ